MNKIKDMFSNMPKFHLSKAAKKLLMRFLIFIFIVLLIIFIVTKVIEGKHTKECNELRDKILLYTDDYMTNRDLYPTLNGTSKTVNLDYLESNVIFKEKAVKGTVTYTKHNQDYIKTLEISNVDYCTTKEFKKETNKYDKNKNTKVTAYFNYYTVETYNSKWTKWLSSDQISTETTDTVLLPLDSKNLPAIPDAAIITEYVRETKTFYSYRDKKWRWYRNDIKYSDYSSTKPSGYANKDEDTLKYTEYTDWSLDYPSEESYRSIKTTTGYRWYKEEGKEKVYWESGKYSPDSPGKEYTRDRDTEVKMYSYRDKLWRWYNGDTKRGYSALSSTQPTKQYKYKDNATLTYTNWTDFYEDSRVTNDNKGYREENKDTHSRYLIKYKIRSFAMLENPCSLEELEIKLNKSYQDILNDKTIDVEVIFKYQTEG